MRAFRFIGPGITGGKPHSYAYLRCWPWETRAIMKLIAAGRTNITRVTWEPGPKAYFAQFIMTVRKSA